MAMLDPAKTGESATPVLFVCYAREDASWRDKVVRSLRPLESLGLFLTWYDERSIPPGTQWHDEIIAAIGKARAAVVLVSVAAGKSKYIINRELPLLLNRVQCEGFLLFPIYLETVERARPPWQARKIRRLWDLEYWPSTPPPLSERKDEAECLREFLEAFILAVRAKSGCGPSLARSGEVVVPTEVTDPVGRERAIAEVLGALRCGESLVLTGLAGIGKTTLLAAAVSRLLEGGSRPYDGSGVYFYRMSEGDSDEGQKEMVVRALIHRIAPAADLAAGSEAMLAQARRLVANRCTLFVIDNVDDEASARAVKWLRNGLPGPQMVMAATSRLYEPWSNIRRLRVEPLSEDDSVRLFRRVLEHIFVEGEEAVVRCLCRRIEYHPMAITYLAAECRESGWSVQELDRQTHSLHGCIGLHQRFASTRGTLPAGARRLLDLVGVLETAVIRVDIAEAVATVTQSDLDSLHDRQLVHVLPDRRHLRVHELVRDWCRGVMSGRERHKQTERLRKALARFYVGFLNDRRAYAVGELAEIDAEWHNILGLIDNLDDAAWALALADAAIGDHFDDPNGYVPRRKQTPSLLRECAAGDPERRTRGDKLLALAATRGCDALLVARIEKNLGLFHYWQGAYAAAEALFSSARERYRRAGNAEGQVATTWLLGYIADDLNCYQEAQALYEEGTSLAARHCSSNAVLQAVGLHLIGCTLYHQGRFDEALARFHQAERLACEAGDQHLLARISRRLATLSQELGRWGDAETRLAEAEALAAVAGRPRDQARLRRLRGMLCLRHPVKGDLLRAEEALRDALGQFEELADGRGRGGTLRWLAEVRRRQGDLTQAFTLCRQSIEVAKEVGNRPGAMAARGAIAERRGSCYGMAAGYELQAAIQQDLHRPKAEVRLSLRRARNLYLAVGHARRSIVEARLAGMGGMDPRLPKGIKGVLFDLMDTLAFLSEAAYGSMQSVVAQGLGVSAGDFAIAWSGTRALASAGAAFRTTADRVQGVAEALHVPLTAGRRNQLAGLIDNLWQREVHLAPDAAQLLDALQRAKLKVAVVCNGPAAMRGLDKVLGLDGMLSAFVLSCDAGVAKPDEGIYHRALAALGLPASTCVFVGDGNDHELDGAARVGLYTVRITATREPYALARNQSLDWDSEVNSLGELQSAFEAWAARRRG
jgi:putative hydrolase of the HAD superfamily